MDNQADIHALILYYSRKTKSKHINLKLFGLLEEARGGLVL